MVGPTSQSPPLGQLSRHCFGARIVEAHPVDQGFVRDRPEQARSGVARLRMPSHTAEFTKAKTENFPNWDRGSMFVHSRRETERIGEAESEELNRQHRRTPQASKCVTQPPAVAQPC